MQNISNEKLLRKRLLNWHYKKIRTLAAFDLLQSGYQCFRRNVAYRLGHDVDFRTAIKMATFDELRDLEAYRDEERLGI